ncbi:MAG TPA: transporter [Spirochaetota bacterium]|nr:transporter [Spirochaetota bacterium]
MLVFCAGAAIGNGSDGYDIEGDRPDVTESALTVPPGSLQIESGVTGTFFEDGKEYTAGEMLLRLGVYGPLEARFGFNSWVIAETDGETEEGREDLSVGIKIQVLKAGIETGALCPNLALIFSTTFPSGTAPYRNDHAEPWGTVSVGWELPADFHLGLNIVASWPYGDGGRYRAWGTSEALAYSPTDRLCIYVEHFMEGGEDDESLHFADAGMTFIVTSGFQVDFRIGINLNGPIHRFAGAGFIARIDGLY